jgi:WD40 repeat protein
VSTSTGIRVFNTHEFQSTFKRAFEGGMRMAEMLFRTNIIALVGTGDSTSYPRDRLILWDDIAHRPFSELNFKSDVLNVKLRKDRVFVALVKKVYVYNFENLECSSSFNTCDNPQGLLSVSTAEDKCVMAIPDEKVGSVKLVHFKKGSEEYEIVQVMCHTSGIAALRLSQDGSVLATASPKGTLIRAYETSSGKQIADVRRGMDVALISDLVIDPKNKLVACSSDKGTVHVFNIGSGGDEVPENKRSTLSALGGYFNSEWSFA